MKKARSILKAIRGGKHVTHFKHVTVCSDTEEDIRQEEDEEVLEEVGGEGNRTPEEVTADVDAAMDVNLDDIVMAYNTARDITAWGQQDAMHEVASTAELMAIINSFKLRGQGFFFIEDRVREFASKVLAVCKTAVLRSSDEQDVDDLAAKIISEIRDSLRKGESLTVMEDDKVSPAADSAAHSILQGLAIARHTVGAELAWDLINDAIRRWMDMWVGSMLDWVLAYYGAVTMFGFAQMRIDTTMSDQELSPKKHESEESSSDEDEEDTQIGE